jgi:hypothetical protein
MSVMPIAQFLKQAKIREVWDSEKNTAFHRDHVLTQGPHYLAWKPLTPSTLIDYWMGTTWFLPSHRLV